MRHKDGCVSCTRNRESWGNDDGREHEAAKRELDNALRELGQSV